MDPRVWLAVSANALFMLKYLGLVLWGLLIEFPNFPITVWLLLGVAICSWLPFYVDWVERMVLRDFQFEDGEPVTLHWQQISILASLSLEFLAFAVLAAMVNPWALLQIAYIIACGISTLFFLNLDSDK